MAKLDKQNVEDILSLTPIQKGILFHFLKDPQSDEYFEQVSLKISGKINFSAFTRAWSIVIKTNEQLRTLFRWEKVKEPVQIILKTNEPQISFHDIQEILSDKENEIEKIKFEDRQNKFDLREVPFRITLCKIENESYEMIISNHHILYDGWSNGIILKEFLQVYESLINEEEYSIPNKKKYKEFVKHLKKQDREEQKTFWQTYLKGFNSQTMLQSKNVKEHSDRSDRHYSIRLSKQKFEEFSRKNEVTLASLIYSIWGIVLQKNNNTDDVVFGSTVSGRSGTFDGIEDMVGLFINTLPLRVKKTKGETSIELIQSVNKALLNWETFGSTSLADIKKYSELDEKTELFDSIVVFENYPLDKAVVNKNSGITFESYSAFEMTNYGLTLSITAFNDIEICFSYNEQLFSSTAIERLARHFLLIADQVVQNRPVSQIEIVSKDEKQEILHSFNNTSETYTTDLTISQLFERQARKTPNQKAIFYKGYSISYSELDTLSNRLSNTLLENGVQKGDIVGIMTDPSVEMIVGILAVLKSGAAYMPIDPDYPSQRIEHMLLDSGSKLLLTDSNTMFENASLKDVSILFMKDDGIYSHKSENPGLDLDPSDLSTVFYTSGTTGKPKGVMIENRNVANVVQWFGNHFSMEVNKNLLQLTNFVFDPSLEDFFGTLLFGATLHIADKELMLDKDRFCDYVDEHNIHIINFIPTVLKELLCHNRKLTSLKTVISGGERLEESLKDDLIRKGYDLYNNYGPAETTVDALSKKCTASNVTLGKPISNVKCYVLDNDRNLNPVGVAGELYISGEGVSRGYLNLQETTEKNFFPDPFHTSYRMYKTGDIARWLPNGEIEFIGRTDHQVKIRGYRIELGEINTALLSHEAVKDVAVIDWNNHRNNKVLCAYYVSEVDIESRELKAYLTDKLPEYMIPSYFVRIDKLPLTSIGKIDRKKLPDPSWKTNKDHVLPINKIEEDLLEVWSAVLGINQESMSTEDNFFELGGDSILSIQIVGRALQKDIEMTVNQMFEHQTISDLAKVVNRVKKEEVGDIASTVSGEAPLLPIQKWFFNQDLVNYNHWNQSILLSTHPSIESEKLKESFIKLIEYHDTFRLRYRKSEGEWVQSYTETGPHFLFDEYNLSINEVKLDEVYSKLQYGLNITEGPLIRAAYFDAGDDAEGKLFITAHHLVVDGYSWRVLIEDLQNIYEQIKDNHPVRLPAKSLSYKSWSEKVQEFAESEKLKEEFSYWMNNIPSSVKAIPVDITGGSNTEQSASIFSVMLSEKETSYLLHDIHKSFNTRIEDVLLSGLSSTLGNWCGKTLVDLEGHGRNSLLKEHDISRTVGWFTCVYPMVLGDVDPHTESDGVIKQVKERYRSISNGGIGYEILYYLSEMGLREKMVANPKAEISFNYLGQSEQVFRKNRMFEISDFNTGPVRDPKGIRSHLLDVDCMIVHGRLKIDWKYSKNAHKRETIEGLANDYILQLKQMIAFSSSVNRTQYTPSDFPLVSINQEQVDALVEGNTIEDIYALSPVQKSMVFHTIYSPESSVTVEQTVFSIESDLNIRNFEKVWQTILNRHESLRSSYHWEGLEEPVQVVHNKIELPFKFIDWTSKHGDLLQDLEQFIEEDRQKGFELSKPPLMRVTVVKRDECLYDVIWTHHHLQLDGWCNSILLKEIGELYRAYCEDEEINLSEALPYKEYIKWLSDQNNNEAEKFWRKTLKGFKTPIRFNNIFPAKSSGENPSFGNAVYEVSEEQKHAMQVFAKKHRITLNTMVQGAWAILLNRYSEEQDITFGVTSSGRPAELKGSENMIGCFMNTLPFRAYVDPNMDLVAWLKNLQLKQVEMRQYEFSSLADIRSWSEVPRNSALFDLYESIVIVENYPFDESLKEGIGPLKVKSLRVEEQMDYPIVVYCNLQPHLHFKLLYDGEFLNEKEAKQILEHLMNILNEMLQFERQEKLNDITMLKKTELTHLLNDLNRTQMEYPNNASFIDLFSTQVAKRPGKPAIIQGNESLSYNELDILSNKLAHKLIDLGVGTDTPVGIYVERSPKMAICIMGILKAGGAFLPIDSEYPGDRVNMMLSDGDVPVLLSQSDLLQKISNYNGHCVSVDTEWNSILEEPSHQPYPEVKNKDLAYVIYTSGSSGRPKAIMMPHEAVVSHSVDMIKRFSLNPEDRVLQFSSISFDISLEQIFSTLAAGSALVLRDKEIWTPQQFSQRCTELKLSVVNLPTSYWGEITQAWYTRPELIPDCNLRLVIVGGEQMLAEKVRLWEQLQIDHVVLLNAYGPAETAMTSTLFKVSGEGVTSGDLKFIPVGKPLANRRIYILDEHFHPVPKGIKGEIHIGGVPLARGYLNKPEMTKEKFIKDPYYSGYGDRLYKTGDIGKLLPDGNIQVLGRKDDQTKIRGHRIDIGEIEATMNHYEPLIDSVVVIKERETGEKYLVAYYVTADKSVDSSNIRKYLKDKLPEYMVPSFFIGMEKLPLSPNGKIDRKNLANLNIHMDDSSEIQRPTNEVQQKLVGIWEKILGISGIGINHHFFEIGGQSLKAITLVSEIHKEFGIEIPLGKIFEAPTIQDLAYFINERDSQDFKNIPNAKKQDFYEVSPAQRRMYVVDQLNGASTNYNISGAVYLEGNIDSARLENSFLELIQRHESLRTSFTQTDGKVLQKIHEKVDWSIEKLYSNEQDLEDTVANFIKPFDLNNGPLFRALLVEVTPAKHLLVYDMHHIISDGLSLAILIREFASLYQGGNLPELNIQYKDFSAWQNQLIDAGTLSSQKKYWHHKFSDEIPVLNLPTDLPRSEIVKFEGDSIVFDLEPKLTKKLNQVAKEKGITLYSLLLSAFNILLGKYSRQEDIVIGSPVAGRSFPELENIVGMFVNTLALRNQFRNDMTVDEFVGQVSYHTLKALENQDYPFEMLVDELNIQRNLNRHPLFDVMFAFENVDEAKAELEDFIISPYSFSKNTAKFDLELKVTEHDGSLSFTLEYKKDLFKNNTIQLMSEHLVNVLDSMANDLTVKIGDIKLVTQKELDLISKINDNGIEYPSEKTIKQLFEEQVLKYPDRTALVYGHETISYEVLNSRANRLANRLIEKGAGPNKVIALLAEPSIEMMIGLWGIIKTGATYLPIDPQFPDSRIEIMIKASAAIAVLTESHLLSAYKFNCDILDLKNEELYSENSSNPLQASTSGDPLYIIYTSGTTGEPKGVPVKNKSLMNYISWFTREASISYKDRTALLSSFAFDLGYTSLYSSLLNGSELHLLPKEEYSIPDNLITYLGDNEISYMKLTPSLFSQLVSSQSFEENERLSKMRLVILGGEKLKSVDLLKFNGIYPNTKVMNHYGPTESTIGSVAQMIDFSADEQRIEGIIGKPIDNTRIFILDNHKNLMPIGITGEICIEGVGLSDGYLNGSEITNEKFIETALLGNESIRLYRTGDLGRITREGMVEFLGRNDDQLKIKGYRVEPNEVMSTLRKHDSVLEAIVLPQKNQHGENELYAYLVLKDGHDGIGIREHASQYLPYYMLPSAYINLDLIPLKHNGKVDAAKLKNMTKNKVEVNYYEEPLGHVEQRIEEMWKDILGVEKIGVHDSFFELGGNSLKVMQVTVQIHKEFYVNIPLREVFKKPTIRGLREYINNSSKDTYDSLQPIKNQKFYELSSAQRRLYTLQHMEGIGTTYNMPRATLLEGDLNLRKFKSAIGEIINSHEALRTSFEVIDSEPKQIIRNEVDINIELAQVEEPLYDQSGNINSELNNIFDDFIRPFNLTEAPLFRIKLIQFLNGKQVLLTDMHHIISDGYSVDIMLKELAMSYEGQLLEKNLIQYKDFAAWQNEFLKTEMALQQKDYWLNVLSEDLPTLNMPTDFPRPAFQNFEGESLSFVGREDLKVRLDNLCKEADVTMNMVLTAAYSILLSKYTSQHDIVIGFPVLGRTHADTQRTIGMFANTIAIRSFPKEDISFESFLNEVKESLVDAYDNQDYQFDLLLDDLKVKREPGRNPIFSTMLTIQENDEDNQIIGDINLCPIPYHNAISKFDFSLFVNYGKTEISFEFEFAKKLFKLDTIKKFAEDYLLVLDTISSIKNIKLKEIEIESFIEDETELEEVTFNF